MKREAWTLLRKAIDSLILSVDHFNRPWDCGRQEAVLILLDRAFELLMKAAIIYQGGKIRQARSKETIGFDHCVRICLSDGKVKCLTEEEALTIQTINSLRDAAQHYMLDISERLLYLYAQAGFTLFRGLLKRIFNKNLVDEFPERVLPISTTPPSDFVSLIEAEFDDIKRLITPGKRRRLQARAKLRALAIIEKSLGGERSQPGESELGKLLQKIIQGKNWHQLFPGIATLSLDTSGTGINVSIRITKKEGEPVHLVPPGTPGATVVAVKRVSELSYYSLGLKQLSEKLGITPPKTLAMINHLRLQESDEYFRIIRVGNTRFKRYSQKALDLLKKELPEVDLDAIWEQYKLRRLTKS